MYSNLIDWKIAHLFIDMEYEILLLCKYRAMENFSYIILLGWLGRQHP